MKRKGIIFDLDGVLIYTDEFHYQAWKKIADRLGIYFDKKINNRLRGVSRMESLEIVLEQYEGASLSVAQKLALAEEKNDVYRGLLQTMRPEDVSEEVRETLRELRKKGYKLAIGSSSKNAKFILKQVDLAEAFDGIADGTNIKKSKPDPEVFLKAAEFIGLPPEKCAVVEDALAGIAAARAAGMYAIGIGDAGNDITADARIVTFKEILDLV